MHKIKLILLLILPISVFAQDLGIIDTRTTKNPALNGTYRISTDGKNLFFRNFIGISEKVANTDSATFTGLITLPSTTSIGNVSSTELSYLDGVTSSIQTQLGNKQPQLNGTGFVKASGTTISYDNSTYLTTSSASSTYLPLAGGTITGSLTLNNGAKFVGQVGTLYNGNQVYVDFLGTSYGRIQSYNAVGSFGMPLVLQGSGSNVGIGMVPTTRKLEVSDVIRSIGGGFEAITPFSSGSSYRWILNTTDDKFYLQNSTDKFVSNFSTRLLVDNSGNVGIGTTSPSEKLNVTGNILASGTVLGSNLSGTNTGDNATNTQYSGLAASKQDALNGTGFVKASGTTISYDNSTYLTTSSASSTYAPIASPTFTGTVSGITKSMVGLGLVDNTTDATKPISTATQTALDAKQATLNGTGFVKSTAGTISYDNSTYLTTSTAASTYLPISNPTATGTLTAPTISNTLGANFATTSGSVGIGTTSPQNLLHVKGTSAVGLGVRNSHFIIESAETAGVDVGAVLKFAGQSGNTVNPYSFGTIEAKKESALTNNYSSYLAFHTIGDTGGSTERMRINGSGNVGIGTTGASYKLHVLGGNIYVGGAGAGVRIEDRSLSSRSFQLYVDGGALAFYNHNNSTQPVTITDGGNFGIGTTTPASKLHISGTGDNTFKIASTATNNPYLNLTLQNASTTPYGVLEAGDGVAYRALVLNPTSGNVGIGTGTTAPAYKLDVTGTSRFTSKMIINSAFNSGLSLLNGSSNGQIFNDGNLHLEAAEYLWINGNSTSLTSISAGGGNTYINSGGGRVGIGTTTPVASAILDITSTTQGVLFPRLTTTQINAITSPANGLTVYNTTLAVLCFYDGTGWKRVAHLAM